MFRNTRVAGEAAAIDAPAEPQAAEPVPLSVLALDLVDAPASGWTVWLAERGISIAFDDIGRPSIARTDAKRLLDDQRQAELRRQDQLVRLEAAAVEQDRAWRASLPKGVAWHEVPPGVPPVVAMTEAAKAEQPRRTPTRNEWLFGEVDDTMVYHEFPAEDGGAS
jgi:hypothetical protein